MARETIDAHDKVVNAVHIFLHLRQTDTLPFLHGVHLSKIRNALDLIRTIMTGMTAEHYATYLATNPYEPLLWPEVMPMLVARMRDTFHDYGPGNDCPHVAIYAAIAAILNHCGVKNRKGTAFTHQGIQKILSLRSRR